MRLRNVNIPKGKHVQMRRKKEENKAGERTLNLAAMSESNTNRTHSADVERVPTTKYEIGKSEREDDMGKRGGGEGGGDACLVK